MIGEIICVNPRNLWIIPQWRFGRMRGGPYPIAAIRNPK
jgi:hypothetical protein